MRSNNILFHGASLSAVFDAQHKALREKIDNLSSDYIFNVDEDDLVRSLVDQFTLGPPKLNIDARTIDSSEEVRLMRDEFSDAYDIWTCETDRSLGFSRHQFNRLGES